MSHTDPVILALRALGETAGTAEDAEHAQTCPQCRSELSRLAGIVELARDGVSMISLGELNASQTGIFIIPPGTDLRNYSRIDISLQPFNGSTAHSKTSVVRGSLPVAAIGAVSPR